MTVRAQRRTEARGILRRIWRQVPFLIWLVLLWMLLWGQVTVVSLLTGIAAAIFVTNVFRLPPVELSGRVNVWYAFLFVATFVVALVRGSLTVAWQVLNPRHYPGTAIVEVPLQTDDDFIMATVAVTSSLIPGSLVLEVDTGRRVIFLHVLGVESMADAEAQRVSVRRWESRIVKAIGSRAQVAQLVKDPHFHKPSAGAS